GVLHVMENLGRAQQRLGRDAAPVQADAAEIGFLDHRGLEAELGCTDRRDISAGTGADDDDVEGCVGHGYALVFIVATISGSSPSLRGALATKQSTFIALEMDCFAALAMTDASSAVTPSS